MKFYYRYNDCYHCQRFDVLFLGSLNNSYKFIFKGYRKKDDEPIHAPRIVSYNDWLIFVAKTNGKIFNEYNEEVSLRKFMTIINDTNDLPTANGVLWFDEYGNSFN